MDCQYVTIEGVKYRRLEGRELQLSPEAAAKLWSALIDATTGKMTETEYVKLRDEIPGTLQKVEKPKPRIALIHYLNLYLMSIGAFTLINCILDGQVKWKEVLFMSLVFIGYVAAKYTLELYKKINK